MSDESLKFLRAAKQRFATAEFLLSKGYNLDSMYLAGYTMECALKALILDRTPAATQSQVLHRITHGSSMHYVETLKRELVQLSPPVPLPLEIVKRLRRSNWTTDLRYETGRTDTGETRAFLKTAQAILLCAEGLMQNV